MEEKIDIKVGTYCHPVGFGNAFTSSPYSIYRELIRKCLQKIPRLNNNCNIHVKAEIYLALKRYERDGNDVDNLFKAIGDGIADFKGKEKRLIYNGVIYSEKKIRAIFPEIKICSNEEDERVLLHITNYIESDNKLEEDIIKNGNMLDERKIK